MNLLLEEFNTDVPSYNIDEQDLDGVETLSHFERPSNINDDSIEPGMQRIPKKGRSAQLDALLEQDKKYESIPASRKELFNDSFADSDSSINDREFEGFRQKFAKNVETRFAISPQRGIPDNSLSDSNHEEDDTILNTIEDNSANFQIFSSQSNVSEDVKKGKAVIHQSTIWEALLEVRIHLQKSLLIANILPNPAEFDSFVSETPNTTELLDSTQLSIEKLVENLLTLRHSLISENTEFLKVANNLGLTEIPNISKLSNETNLNDSFNQCFTQYQNNIISEWNDKTKLMSNLKTKKNILSIDRPIIEQIEAQLNRKEELIKRTQLKRLQYNILSKLPKNPQNDCSTNETEEGASKRDSHLEDYNEGIFDDTDFYHQLLQDLIKTNSSSNLAVDPIILGKRWLEASKKRLKPKRNINTKASKGRKLRYTAYPKLVNFMSATMYTRGMQEPLKDGLFNSLFGKKVK